MHESLQGATFHIEHVIPQYIEGLTAVGRATVDALNMNHSRRQRIREVEKAFGLYPPRH
jgi:hypothetical protein